MIERDTEGRAYFEEVLHLAVDELVAANPELAHVHGSQILFVAGAARKEARASVRPLTYGASRTSEDGRWVKPLVVIDGVEMLYEICLRPRFFELDTTEARMRVLAHELWHVSATFDGTLDPGRRHRGVIGDHEAEVEPLVEAWQSRASEVAELLVEEPEVRLQAWRSRPPSRVPSGAATRDYDERDLYAAVVVTPTSALRRRQRSS